MNATAKSPLVVCFGDSLTAGFQTPSRDNPTGGETPYGVFLQEMVGPSIQVVVSGICGELTGEMVTRGPSVRQTKYSTNPT